MAELLEQMRCNDPKCKFDIDNFIQKLLNAKERQPWKLPDPNRLLLLGNKDPVKIEALKKFPHLSRNMPVPIYWPDMSSLPLITDEKKTEEIKTQEIKTEEIKQEIIDLSWDEILEVESFNFRTGEEVAVGQLKKNKLSGKITDMKKLKDTGFKITIQTKRDPLFSQIPGTINVDDISQYKEGKYVITDMKKLEDDTVYKITIQTQLDPLFPQIPGTTHVDNISLYKEGEYVDQLGSEKLTGFIVNITQDTQDTQRSRMTTSPTATPGTLTIGNSPWDIDEIKKESQIKQENDDPTPEEIYKLCMYTRHLLKKDKDPIPINAPITIVGDIHGQFEDLRSLFKIGDKPSNKNPYLFLGDYVDRGNDSIKTLCLLFAYKIKYPKSVYLLRGNHETKEITNQYEFTNELYGVYRNNGKKVWDVFCDCFNCLPFTAVVSESIFCVHGGLSPNLKKLDQIAALPSPHSAEGPGIREDLIWADPNQNPGFTPNSSRCCSYYFGLDKVTEFLEKNNLSFICRAHQVVQNRGNAPPTGWQKEFTSKEPKLFTLFSAPNYPGYYPNAATIMVVHKWDGIETYKGVNSTPIQQETEDGKVYNETEWQEVNGKGIKYKFKTLEPDQAMEMKPRYIGEVARSRVGAWASILIWNDYDKTSPPDSALSNIEPDDLVLINKEDGGEWTYAKVEEIIKKEATVTGINLIVGANNEKTLFTTSKAMTSLRVFPKPSSSIQSA